jgi:polysaccharide biosynthesis protein PslG
MLMRRVTGLAIVPIVVMLLAVPAAEAKGGFFGLNWSALRDRDWSGKDARQLKKSGAKTVRVSIFWARIERSSGQFDWSTPDQIVGDLASKGIRVLPILYGTPPWLANTPSKPPIDSKRTRDAWQRFLRNVLERYGPGGSYWSTQYLLDHPAKAALPIGTWQIWNEPNLESHWSPKTSPGGYADLLKLSDKALKDADPKAKVMFAGMPGYSNDIDAWDFLRRVYRKRGVKRAFDVAALHPYAHNVSQMKGEVKRLRKTMAKHGDRRKSLWITEIGWGSLPKDATPYRLTKGKQGQKRILKHSFRALKKKRHQWHIRRVLWFNFRDPRGGGVEQCSFCSSAGLLNYDFSRKPSWSAFREFTR